MNRLALQAKLPRSTTAKLRAQAEARLRRLPQSRKQKIIDVNAAVETQRLLHELQVHQIELEMQNAELQESRNRAEALMEKYLDLYDFAPVGYLSLDEQGQILEVNLTAAALLGLGRSRLINRFLPSFVVTTNRAVFLAFLKQVFAGVGKQVCEATLSRQGGAPFWANIHGAAAASDGAPRKWCRVIISDITALKISEEAQHRLNALEEANGELRQEIVRRKAIEESLKKSEQHQNQLLEHSQVMHEQLRHLSRQVLQAQEEERKRISRELHDVIAQTLTGINVQLASLAKESAIDSQSFDRNITRTQRLVEKSVDIIHEFARELRPAVLDDLGLIPALHSFMKHFTAQTGIRVHLSAYAGVEQVETARRTALFRIAQEALTNVARHAHANRVEVTIRKRPDCISMEIKDDGKSFEVERTFSSKGNKRLGLLGMRERLEMVGGRLNIESKSGTGTTVTAQIPCRRSAGGTKLPLSVP